MSACLCGCGQITATARKTSRARGVHKGDRNRYVVNHQPRNGRVGWTAEYVISRYVTVGRPDDCWEWEGVRSKAGYGLTQLNSRQLRAHRLAYEVANGPIADGQVVRHTCDNKPCCNPSHLLTGNALDNSRDAVERNRVAFGERQWMAILIEPEAIEIRRRRNLGEKLRVLAEEFAVSEATVASIAKGKTWRRAGRNEPNPQIPACAGEGVAP